MSGGAKAAVIGGLAVVGGLIGANMAKSKNKNASSDELLEMGKNYSIEDTIARHGK